MNRNEPIYEDVFYHVYNRGNDRRLIFREDSDYSKFLEKVKLLSVRYSVGVSVYAIMPNHYHMIAKQMSGGGLSSMMGVLGTATAKTHNLKYGHTGHLFGGPFRYKAIDEENLGMSRRISI